jgi:hypothetical protein
MTLIPFTRPEANTVNKPLLVKVNAVYEIKQWLQENDIADAAFTESIAKEIILFLRFSGAMLLAFPAGLWMRKRVRKNPRLHYILKFPALKSVRNNIEKGSFAYDTLLF